MMLSKSQIKYYSSLKQKKIRIKKNKFIAEGKRLIQEGLNSSFVCESVIVNFSFAESNSNFINNIKSKGFKVISCSDNDFSKLTSTENPQGILAIFKSFLPKKEFFKDKIIIGLENISDPGNLGTILRSCDWFGINTVILSEGCADLFNPKVIRSSMGAIFHLNILEKQNIISNLLELKKLGYQTREKIVIIFTDKVKLEENDEIEFIEFMNNIKKNKIKFSIIVVGLNLQKVDDVSLIKILANNNMSCYLSIDNMHKLRKVIMTPGEINEVVQYTNEKYEPGKKKSGQGGLL